MIRRTDGTLYHQIKQWLRGEIEHLSPDAPIPSELSIAKQFGVSRGTVRQAIADLVHEQLIYRIQGKGSFKSPVAVNHTSAHMDGLTRQLMDCGLQPSITDIALDTAVLPEPYVEPLQLAADAPVWRLQRVWRASGRPISLGVAYIPQGAVPGLHIEAGQSLLQALSAQGITIARAESYSRAVLADALCAEQLQVPVGAAILQMTYYGYTADGRPAFVEVTRTVGEHYVLHVTQQL